MLHTATTKQPIDKALLQIRFRNAANTYNEHALVQKQMAKMLVAMAQQHISEQQANMLELGCGTGLLTQEITNHFQSLNYIANDLVKDVERNLKSIFKPNHHTTFRFIQGDAEKICLAQKQNVIWSGATMQWIEDLDSFFARMNQQLNKDGYFALSSFDIDNFSEIKAITGKGINYKPIQDIMIYASKYFKILGHKSWHHKLWFKNPIDVLKHMRYTGVNGISATQWGRKDLERFNNEYKIYQQEKGYPLTYHPFVLILQKI